MQAPELYDLLHPFTKEKLGEFYGYVPFTFEGSGNFTEDWINGIVIFLDGTKFDEETIEKKTLKGKVFSLAWHGTPICVFAIDDYHMDNHSWASKLGKLNKISIGGRIIRDNLILCELLDAMGYKRK